MKITLKVKHENINTLYKPKTEKWKLRRHIINNNEHNTDKHKYKISKRQIT